MWSTELLCLLSCETIHRKYPLKNESEWEKSLPVWTTQSTCPHTEATTGDEISQQQIAWFWKAQKLKKDSGNRVHNISLSKGSEQHDDDSQLS